ncbi:MAG: WhiB family transcriptional regulator [Actinomycetota bacterium]|jgi:WhiB family redox-sensing transcriptional regulator|nr:WhiB family transcriptional regulator [Actinomycetota bacterium]MED6327429.1 WhiB family transcriptional regulator [Actinomycetota bacterium]MEE2957930.1 WhiB family transcriptional regulator [Actinomycetota bacterium]
MSNQVLELPTAEIPVVAPPDWDGKTAEGAASTWMSQGTCAGSDPDVFFPHDGMGVEVAKQVCATCAVTEPCLEYALAHRIEHGVWGGCSERQRRRILRARRAAAREKGLIAVAA